MDAYTTVGSIKAAWRRTMGRSPVVLAAALGLLVVTAGGATLAFGMTEEPEVSEMLARMDSPVARAPKKVEDPEPLVEQLAQAEAVSPATAPSSEPPEPVDVMSRSDVVGVEADAEAVYRALRQRKVRALDLLLVAPEPVIKRRRKTRTRRMNFGDAVTYCEGLDIDGVQGWRLPTIGELNSLTKGRLLDDAKFWSATKADTFGQSRVVWNSRDAKMGPAPIPWKGGRVACVRPTVPVPEGEPFENPED
jgi:hypothetical protein